MISILDCTLRDGGYINGWEFLDDEIKGIIDGGGKSNIDFVECGYLNSTKNKRKGTIFTNIEEISDFLPQKRDSVKFLAMADVQQFKVSDITPYSGRSVDGIRVVFYKHQVDDAIELCKAVNKNGYKLFVQPMVTVDYTKQEYIELIEQISNLRPYAVSIVDSFGYMNSQEINQYFNILDVLLDEEVIIGVHSHNNMQLAFTSAKGLLEYNTKRDIIIDSSLYGMGRGAGNLNTELITNYYNSSIEYKYNLELILDMISKYIMPIKEKRDWGYSPYLYLTGLYHCHPNFACYLLENHEITVSEFRKFIQAIPVEMKTKCRKPYVEELYQNFIKNRR